MWASMRGFTRVLVLVVVLLSASSGFASADPRPVPDAEYFSLVALVRDEEGVEVPVRSGDETLGHAKACWKHNFCSLRAISLTISGRGNKQPPEGPRVVYRAHLVGNGVNIDLKVVVDTSTFTIRGYQTDGHTTGLITAYCEGMPRCPDELNST
jgi:hypothetical protein